jgi:hypothetical protein
MPTWYNFWQHERGPGINFPSFSSLFVAFHRFSSVVVIESLWKGQVGNIPLHTWCTSGAHLVNTWCDISCIFVVEIVGFSRKIFVKKVGNRRFSSMTNYLKLSEYFKIVDEKLRWKPTIFFDYLLIYMTSRPYFHIIIYFHRWLNRPLKPMITDDYEWFLSMRFHIARLSA